VQLLGSILGEKGASLMAMLVSHHHYDHCFGVPAWLAHTRRVVKYARHESDEGTMRDKAFQYEYLEKEEIGP
jgi:glyoxylase-like metal-dependent hydrolase (beta-lactamase superfamily II)